MKIIGLNVAEFLTYVCFNTTSYEDIYKYIYRQTNFDEVGIAGFKTEIEKWINRLISNKRSQLDFYDSLATLDDEVLEEIKNANPLIFIQLENIYKILEKGIDLDIHYSPLKRMLTEEDDNKVSAILKYTEPLLNGTIVKKESDYGVEILDDKKIIQGGRIIQQMYNEYKDFIFEVNAINVLHYTPIPVTSLWVERRLNSFRTFFLTYEKEVRFILEIVDNNENFYHESQGEKNIYEYDRTKMLNLYNFCQEDVFSVPYRTFVEAIETANFSKINESNNLSRNKFYFAISVMKNFVKNADWYKKAANSIGLEPTACSKKNVPVGWKNAIKAIK